MTTDPRKRAKTQPPRQEPAAQPVEPQHGEHVERDDYLESDALDARGHGEQPEGEREADLVGRPATHQPPG